VIASLDENQDPWYFEIGDDAIELHTRQEKQAYICYSLALNLHLLGQTSDADEPVAKARKLAIDLAPIKAVIAADLRRLAAARPEWVGPINSYRDHWLGGDK
jgi:hypothetical protein